MDNYSSFSRELEPRAQPASLLARLLSGLGGGGAVEYLIIIGACSLAGLIGFKQFGSALRTDLDAQAQHILGKGTPKAALPNLTKPPGLKPILDGFVPPTGFFPACGVNGCSTCPLPRGTEAVGSISLALTSREASATTPEGGTDPRASGCSGTVEPPPVESECPPRYKRKRCDLKKWLTPGRSPDLSGCKVSTASSTPPYDFDVEQRDNKECNVNRIRVDEDGNVTFCLTEIKLKVTSGDPNKLAMAKEVAAAANRSFCPQGTVEATYTPLDRDPPTSRVDLNRYALKDPQENPYVVLIPVTKTGPGRSDSDDTADFANSRDALAVQMLRNEGIPNPTPAQIEKRAGEILKDYQSKGYTWHHADLVKGADGHYYYSMVLVPSAIHDTASHDGGSTWAASQNIRQNPDRPDEDVPPWNPPWDPAAPPPATSPVFDSRWNANDDRELPRECTAACN